MGGDPGRTVVQRGDHHPKKLILAAADYADGYRDDDDNPLPPPPELVLAWQVQQWGHAAVFGNQPIPARTMRCMSACLNYYNATLSFKAGSFQAAEWAKQNPSQLKLVTHIREMRTHDGR